jgi:fibro-slime domain-containing protein
MRDGSALPAFFALAVASLLTACGDDGASSGPVGAGGSAAQASGGGSAFGGNGGSGAAASGGSGALLNVDAGGGSGGSAAGPGDCGNVLFPTIRDFTEQHPDFEHYTGSGLPGIVQPDLGPDQKPVYAHPGGTAHTTGPNEFAQWYNDVPGVNMSLQTQIQFVESSPGVFLYDNGNFFPIDNQGFGNGPAPQHNFLFTTETHTTFTYKGGEVFTFRGDDDLWVFVNGKLAIDLGGLHPAMEQTVSFDALASTLGISIGQSYAMDIFHAERHTSESNFRIETTIACFVPIDVQ